MDEKRRELLRRSHMTIVNDLEPRGDVLNTLYEDGVLTENDLEQIRTASTRKERCRLLLLLLPTRGPAAYGSFQRALQSGSYDNLASNLRLLDDQLENNSVTQTKGNALPSSEQDLDVCVKCDKFLGTLTAVANTCQNAEFGQLLFNHCCLFLDNVEALDLVDQLFQDHVLCADDIERIKSGVSRRDRCALLVTELLKSSKSVESSLKTALSKKYGYIVDRLFPVHPSSTEFTNDISREQMKDKIQVLQKIRTMEADDDEQKPNPKEHSADFRGNEVNAKTRFADIERMKDQVQVLQKLRTKQADDEKKHMPYGQCADLDNSEVHADTAKIERMKDQIQVLQKINAMEAADENAHSSNGQVADLNNDAVISGVVNGTDYTMNSNENTECILAKAVETNESSRSTKQAKLNIRSLEEGHGTDMPTNSNNTTQNGFDDVDGYLAPPLSFPSLDSNIKTTNSSKEDVQSQMKADATTMQTCIGEGTPHVYSTNGTVVDTNTHSNNTSDKSDDSCVNGIDLKSLESKTNNGTRSPPVMQRSDQTRTRPEVGDSVVQRVQSCHARMGKSIAECPCPRPGKRLSTAFNYLSTLINQGDFIKFEHISIRLQQRFHANYDMMCILGYLHASRDLFKTDFDSAKKHINDTMEIVPKTSNPRYFTLELFTAKTRMYVSQKKLEKMQNTLDEALMIFETDPVGLTGRAAGWLYINDARNKTAQLSCLNLSKPNALPVYNRLFARAKSSFQRSMTNFLRDGGKDGPFGFGYALCRLVILLMRCGDNGLTMNETMLEPPTDDLRLAADHMQHLENSDIAIPKIMEMHLRLAKCDYHFRRKNTTRALEHSQIAYEIANDLSMLEFKEHAYNRLQFLRSRQTLQRLVTEISDEEVNQILFGDSSSDTGDSC